MDDDPLANLRHSFIDSRQTVQVRQAIQAIPSAAAVVADELAGTWVAGRKWVTRWPDLRLLPGQCPQYIVSRHTQSRVQLELEIANVLKNCQEQPVRVETIFQNEVWSIRKLSN
jgi:hypothetical protein